MRGTIDRVPPGPIVRHVKPPVFDTLGDLADRADTIIVGTVSEVLPAVFDLARRAAVTDSRIAVERVLKGEPGSELIRVRQWGGILQGQDLRVGGVRHYVLGERLLLFLRLDQQGIYVPFALGQGEFRMPRDDHETWFGARSERPEYFTVSSLQSLLAGRAADAGQGPALDRSPDG